MVGSRVALVAGDRSMANDVQAFLKEHFHLAPFAETYAGIREFLDRDTDGLLLIAVAGHAELVDAKHLLQDINLQKIPATAVLLDACPHDGFLAGLEPFTFRRLRWPASAESLRAMVKEAGRGMPFGRADSESPSRYSITMKAAPSAAVP